MKRVLVTGATGFIGRNLVEELLKNGYEVKILVRKKGKIKWTQEVEEIQGDILIYDTLPPAMKDIDGMFHLAGVISTRKKDEKFMYEINYIGTKNVFMAAEKAGIKKFLYLASIFALGTGTKDEPAEEKIKYNLGHLPIPYFRAKRAAELESIRYLERGLPIIYVYPTFCIGPGDEYISSSRLVVDFLNGKIPAAAPGGFNVIDVRDTARGLRLGYEKGGIGEKYIIGGTNITYKDFLSFLAQLTGKKAPKFTIPAWVLRISGTLLDSLMTTPPVDYGTGLMAGYYWYYDDHKAREELGHTSRPLEATLKDAVEWFKEHGYIKNSL